MKILKISALFAILTLFIINTEAQKIYNPNADAKKELQTAINLARNEGKNILIQVGGNWCPWCVKMHKLLEGNVELNKLVKESYIFMVVNYSKENKNLDVLQDLGYPQRFGFPVMIVLNSKGTRIHTQNTGNLEKDKSYDLKKIKSFLYNWRPDAFNPEHYK
ncbi:thioredoxin family protein [Ancylomarina longa]|uniref:Thioredoxin family protein n=1 Tax=Ancylomarina longa TaxID=2487017 RepID=A0A434AEW1_9BACT|nr:thioredoxin family protein [Ancylomarina longa]RUT72878.1 thioredoxin family protein [Ancylomarina longa]